MELSIYINILWRYKWLITLTTVVATVIAAIATTFVEPTYSASVMLRIATTNQGGGSWGDTVYATRVMNTYEEIITSRTTSDLLVNQFSMATAPDIGVEIISNTELFQITVEYTDPVIATQAANYLATELVSQSQLVREYRSNPASIAEEARVPRQPSSPNMLLNVILALVAGLGSSVGLAFVLNNLDDRLHTTIEITQKLDVPILGRVPIAKQLAKQVVSPTNSVEAEAFRHIRTNLRNLFPKERYRIITVTSAKPNEGKSTSVANVAQSLAKGGDNVLVIDGDLRQPTIHTLFKLENEAGLVNFLQDKAVLADVIQRANTYENGFIDVLSSGLPTEIPAELLGNGRLEQLFTELRDQYDRILIDTPANLPVTDSAVIAPYTDGLILVISRGQSQNNAVDEALENIRLTNTKLLGVIINRAETYANYRYYQPTVQT